MNTSKIWELVKVLESNADNANQEIGECKATMIVNFGKSGHAVPGLIKDESGRLLPMIISVIEHYQRNSRRAIIIDA